MLIRLLIIDDEPLMVELISRFMEPMCSFIDSASSLSQAVEKASKGHFNVISLDLRLNGTGKEEAFMTIRTLKSYNASVIVISGLLDPKLRDEAMAAGADSFILKGPDMNAQKLLLAANIAVLHLPKESFKSDSFYDHVLMLRKMVSAA